MAVDVRRSGARQAMRIFQGSDDTVTVRWFRCRKHAKVLPVPCAINADSIWMSREWDKNAPIGEASRWGTPTKDDLVWRGPGNHFCGEPSWFVYGIPADHRHDPPCTCMLAGLCLATEDGKDLQTENNKGCLAPEQQP